jgi:hypothetical protein
MNFNKSSNSPVSYGLTINSLYPTNVSDHYMPYTIELTNVGSNTTHIPTYFKHFNAILIGGGGGGGVAGYATKPANSGAGGGGGGGGTFLCYQCESLASYFSESTYQGTPVYTINYTVGGAGSGGDYLPSLADATPGGSTSINSRFVANGGLGGRKGNDNPGGGDSGNEFGSAGGTGGSTDNPTDGNGTGNTGGKWPDSRRDGYSGDSTINGNWINSSIIPYSLTNYGRGGKGGPPAEKSGYQAGTPGTQGYIAIYLFRQ